MLVEEGVLRERVVRDVGNPLESPFFGVPDLRRGAGNLRDVAHSWDDSLGIEVGPQGGGERGVGNEIGAFDELSEGFFPMRRRSLLWDQSSRQGTRQREQPRSWPIRGLFS